MEEETQGIEYEKVFQPDKLAEMVLKMYDESKHSRVSREEIWRDAYSAYKARYPKKLDKAVELAKERGVYINLTRRKVHSARVKIMSLLLENGQIPFQCTPQRRPRFVYPEVQQLQGKQLEDELLRRSKNMEERIRDTMDITDYPETLEDAVAEMTLYGTGITKGVIPKRINHPVYKVAKLDQANLTAERMIEDELVPHITWVSIWDIFPNPDARCPNTLDYLIHRKFYSETQLLKLGREGVGYDTASIMECLEEGEGLASGRSDNESPLDENETESKYKRFEVLEMWGEFPVSILREHMDIEDGGFKSIPVVVTVLGRKVLRVKENPFDGRIPFDFCYWQRNQDSIFGDGIYYSIRDSQTLINFAYVNYMEGKTISSVPMTVIDPNAFEENEDTESIYAGKQFRVKAGQSTHEAFTPVIIPDVTGGLLELIQLVEREADLDSGQSAIGQGESSSFQTKTATGMSILNSNANRLTSEVVRSLSRMITKNVQALYHWYMATDEDTSLKGDFMVLSTGYAEYIAREVYKNQLINLLNVVAQNPEMREYFNWAELNTPTVRAFNMNPEKVLRPAEEVEAMRQQQAEADAANQQRQYDFQIEIESHKALLKEKLAVSADQRKLEMQERMKLIEKGNQLNPVDFEDESILIQEEELKRLNEENHLLMQQYQQMGLGQPDVSDEELLMLERQNEQLRQAAGQMGL